MLLQELKIAHSLQFRGMKAPFEVRDLEDRRREKKKGGECVEKNRKYNSILVELGIQRVFHET